MDGSVTSVNVEPPLETVDAPEFEAFFVRERPRLLGSMVLIAGSSTDAQEIVQESFFRVRERWDRVGSMDNPTGYLFRTALTVRSSAYRRAIRAARRTFVRPASAGTLGSAERDAVFRALAAMTPRHRAAIVLTELHGWSTEEAASILGIRPGTARVLISQGRRTLLAIAGADDAETTDLLRRAHRKGLDAVDAADPFGAFVRYRRRRERNRRIASASAALLLVSAIAGTAIVAGRDPEPATIDGAAAPGASARPTTYKVPQPGGVWPGTLPDGTPIIIVAHDNSSVTVVEAVSPHLATGNVRKMLGWCASSRTFDDPFHGARFGEYGRLVSGPSPTGLVTYVTEPVDGREGSFTIGAEQPALPGDDIGAPPRGPLCTDLAATPLVRPSAVDLATAEPQAPDTPASLIALQPTSPPGSRWEIDGTLLLSPDGSSWLCDRVDRQECVDGAPVEGPAIDGGSPVAIHGRWQVLIEDGVFVDPIRVW